jgi:hypothetical protein
MKTYRPHTTKTLEANLSHTHFELTKREMNSPPKGYFFFGGNFFSLFPQTKLVLQGIKVKKYGR